LAAGPVLGPVSELPGIVVAAGGNTVVFLSASSGALLHTSTDASGVVFYSGAAIARGEVFIGNMSGTFYAFGNAGMVIEAEPSGNTSPVSPR
jgi:hypothetical protein